MIILKFLHLTNKVRYCSYKTLTIKERYF